MSADPRMSTVKMPMPDQVIAGKYRILTRIGSGGMGLVFLAESLSLGNKVALKFLDPEPNDDDTRVARFLREAKVGLEVQHPGAAQVLDLGRDDEGRLYLAFELIEGEDLRELIKREARLPFGESREIALQVAQVLAFAHGRNIVHRDIKPENIRIRRDLAGPHVKVLDFGIARLLKDSGVRLTAEGMLAGTPRYMAPEQVRDDPLDGRTDQYALGLVFFEMLTGAVGIGGRNVSQILMHQLQTVVPPLAFVDPPLANAAVDAFIARACAKEPTHRFPTMAEFIAALQALQVDERRWPIARAPPANGASNAPTKDAKGPPPKSEPPALGELEISDTLIRVPERTSLERRLEVPTDPVREPVERRRGSEGMTAPMPVHDPAYVPLALGVADPPTDPQMQEQRRPPPKVNPAAEKSQSSKGRGAAPVLIPTPALRPAPPVLEMETDPERPQVRRDVTTEPPSVKRTPRHSPPVNDTVMGMAVPRSQNRSRALWWILGALFGLISLALVWWFFGDSLKAAAAAPLGNDPPP